MKHKLRFRTVRPADSDFLLRLYASSRLDIKLSSLPPTQKEHLIRQQFKAQSLHYATHFPDADNLIVLLGKNSIGRFHVHRRTDEIRLVDILLAPDFRGQGVGTQLITMLRDEARVADTPVRLHVHKGNRAALLYQRMGFQVIGEKELHYFMEMRSKLAIIT